MVGLELTVEDVVCRVVGLFEDPSPRIIRPDTQDITAAELQNVPSEEDSYRFAANFAYICGLDPPDEFFWGPGFAGWSRILPWIPAVLSCVPLAGTDASAMKKTECTGPEPMI